MVPVPWMRSEAGRFSPMSFDKIRPNSLTFFLFHIASSVPLRRFYRDSCLPESTGLVLIAAM